MIEFLAGILLGILVGGTGAFLAFDSITKRMAKTILEADETCHR